MGFLCILATVFTMEATSEGIRCEGMNKAYFSVYVGIILLHFSVCECYRNVIILRMLHFVSDCSCNI